MEEYKNLVPPGVRYYTGAPLNVGGEAVGTICAIDWKPNRLSADQKQGNLDILEIS